MRALLIGLLLLLLLVPCRVLAQPPAASAALTPAQARAALDVLNDPKKRAEVTPPRGPIPKPHPAPPAPAPPAAAANPAAAPAPTGLPIPLAPDSLGAQVLV